MPISILFQYLGCLKLTHLKLLFIILQICKIFIQVDEDFKIAEYLFLHDNTAPRPRDPNAGFMAALGDMFAVNKNLNSVSLVSRVTVDRHFLPSDFSYQVENSSLISLMNHFEKYGYRMIDRLHSHTVHPSGTNDCYDVTSVTLHKHLDEEQKDK